jgi:hypothetical protein
MDGPAEAHKKWVGADLAKILQKCPPPRARVGSAGGHFTLETPGRGERIRTSDLLNPIRPEHRGIPW